MSHATRTSSELVPSDVDFVPPLVRSLLLLLRLRGKAVSAAFFLSCLGGGAPSPGACLLAAKQAGLDGRIVHRKRIEDIPTPTLPCVLLLGEGQACVLTSIKDGVAEVFFPETDETVQNVPVGELEISYSGYALCGSLQQRMDRRANTLAPAGGRRWFWDVLHYYMPIYRDVALTSVVINIIGLLSPLFVMNVYDRVVPNNAISTLWVLAAGIVLAYLFDFALRNLRSRFVDVAGRNADVVLSSRLMRKVLTMRFDSKPESTGALVNNVREFESLREFFGSTSMLTLIDLPFLLLSLLLIWFIAGPLVFLPLAAIPLLCGAGLCIHGATKRMAEGDYRQNMQKNALLVEIVNGLETIRVCMAEGRMLRFWESIVDRSADAGMDSRTYKNLAVTVSTLVTHLVTVGMVVWGVYRIADGSMSMGGLIGCNILVGRAMAPLMQIASLLSRLQSSRVALQTLDMLMTLPSEGDKEIEHIDMDLLQPSFGFDHLTFSYPGAERAALADVTFRITAGEKVGIVGRMGSGKSTLGKLLVGLHQPQEGAVNFGGVDIRQLPEVEIRSRVGFLPQDVVLFFGSIRDNIALGDPCLNNHLILRAANLAGVTDFVRSTTAGFGAQVGERGMALSGGQRQAVALARALVRDPAVLVLDEPTSNMDNASEQRITHRLRDVMAQKTLVLITHRLSLLELVDRIIVMDEGRIVDDGPKLEVMHRLRGQPAPDTDQEGGRA